MCSWRLGPTLKPGNYRWHTCSSCCLRAQARNVLALLKHGAHVNAQDDAQNTPLHWAAEFVGIQRVSGVVDSLLRAGAEETILNDESQVAADVVAENV